MRALATIRRIKRIDPIPGADSIEVASVDGWKVVVKRGEFIPGDLAVYIEVDSWVPHELAPFLSNGKEPRTYSGIAGERLRTVKLRGQLSQGLLLPLRLAGGSALAEGLDVTDSLGIKKWEAPVPAQLSGLAKGNFPWWIPKTDEERVQNLQVNFVREHKWYVTEKLDGTSWTCYIKDGEFGVCSRRTDLKETDEDPYWRAARKFGVEEKLRKLSQQLDAPIAVQGELIGEKIQGNRYKLTGHHIYVFNAYNIYTGKYFDADKTRWISEVLGLNHVPLIDPCFEPFSDLTIDGLLEFADGQSKLNPGTLREGLVFKTFWREFSFKAVSNRFLMKTGG